MSKLFAALVVAMLAAAAPALAKTDCEAGFKTHMGKMSTFVNRIGGNDLADALSHSVDAYKSCKAGDGFSPHGVWDKIIADMEAKAGK